MAAESLAQVAALPLRHKALWVLEQL
jgi:hypothetical protein